MDDKRPSGLSLGELIAIVVIIAVLAAILFPVFARARDKAYAAQVKATLTQLDTLNTLEALQTLKGSKLDESSLRQHGAKETSGSNPQFSYFSYIPASYGESVIIAIDTAAVYESIVSIEPDPSGDLKWADDPPFVSPQAFRSIMAEGALQKADITLVHPRLGLVRVTKDKEGLKMSCLAPPKAEAEPSKR